MNSTAPKKSTIQEIEAKFDQMADRYTNIETGQDTALDSPLCMELISKAAQLYSPHAKSILDLGCGGGNYMVKLTTLLPDVNVTLVDLSNNMLKAASERVQKIIKGEVKTIQGDYRNIDLGTNQFDIIIATTTLHHLRLESEWEMLFSRVFNALKPGGSFWISDIIVHEKPEINQFMLNGWFNWIEESHGSEKLNWVKEQYEKEDTPQTLNFQLSLMKKTGFNEIIVLHKHLCFAAFGAIK